jgi:outer membrane protein assembly factor BamB
MSHRFITNRCNAFQILTRLVVLLVVTQVASCVSASANIQDDLKPYSKCWSRETLLDVSSGASADASNVYYFTANNTLEAAELKTGSKVWSTDFGGDVISNLLVTDSSVLFVTAAGGENGVSPVKGVLRAVSRQTGVTAWTATLPASSSVAIGVVDGKIATVNSDGLVSIYVRETGSLFWSQPVGSRVVAEPLFGETITLATESNDLISVDARKGVNRLLRWSRPSSALLLDHNGRILIGDARGNLVFTSSDGDRLWTFKNGARISFLLPYDSEFVVASQDNFIYKLSRSGGVEWKRRLSGRVSSRPTVVGDDAIISITGDPSIYVVDLRSGKILNRIEIGADENSSMRVAGGGPAGFAVVAPNGLSFFAREACPVK